MFTIDCNFDRGVSFGYTSVCVKQNRSCIIKNDGSYTGLDISFDGKILAPNQQISFVKNKLIKTIIIVDKTKKVGTYSNTITFFVNY